MAATKVRLTRPERRDCEDFSKESSSGASPAPAAVRTAGPAAAHPPASPPPSKEGVGGRPRAALGAAAPAEAPARVRAKEPELDDLLAAASSLSPEKRRELLARLSLASQEQGEGREVEMWSEALYEALAAVDPSSPGPAVIRRLVSPSSAWQPVAEFMRFAKFDALKVAERRSVYGMLAKLVVEDARRWSQWSGVPLGPKVCAQRGRDVASTFESAFPGYLRSGLAMVVARRLTSARAG